MTIKNDELDFLKELLERFEKSAEFAGSIQHAKLNELVLSIEERKDAHNKKAKEYIANRRKKDKNYARTKKGQKVS